MDEIEKLADHLETTSLLKVQSVFSHLAASEDPEQDEFTRQQFNLYKQAVEQLKKKLNYSFIQHITNSAGIFRLTGITIGYGETGYWNVWS